MSTIVFTPLPPAMPPEPVERITVDQYHAMIRCGTLNEDSPVELLEGWLVKKMPKNKIHSLTTRRLRKALEKILPAGWQCDSQEPITTNDSEPEPDIGVARAEAMDARDRHPNPQEIGLLVEVSESTLSRDRNFKKRVYARAGIPVYWIVNLVDRCVEVYTDPTGPCDQPDYRQPQIHGIDAAVAVILDGVEIGRIAVKNVIP